MTNPKKKSNPHRGETAAKPKAKARSYRSKSNPHMVAAKPRTSSRRKHNPRGIGSFGITEIMKAGAGAAAGGLGTRSITQLVLGDKNTGPLGYLANAAVAIALGYATAFVASPAWAIGVAAGGLGATILRIWSEQVSQTSPSSLSGLGDLDFSGNGLGAYVQTAFPVPTVSSQQGRFQVVQAPPYGGPMALPAAVAMPAGTPGASAPVPVSPATAHKAASGQPVAAASRFASRY